MGKLTTLSEMQLDAIGEIMNISMGSAATAVSGCSTPKCGSLRRR